MKKLNNKVVFITGANSGIGKACALEAAKEGAIVVVADLKEVDSTETMRELKEISPNSMFVDIDVSVEETVKKAIDRVVKTFGRLDIGVNNAGISGPDSEIHDMDSELWRNIIDVNLTGNFYCVKHELQQFLKQGGGVIVTVSSLAGILAEPTIAPYTASKHGAVGLTKNIAVQYGGRNIRANTVCPYYVETPMTSSAPNEKQKEWANASPMNRIGQANEVAKAVVFFASENSSYCNGSLLTLDGGKSIY